MVVLYPRLHRIAVKYISVNIYISATYRHDSFFTPSLLEIGFDFVIFIISKYVLFCLILRGGMWVCHPVYLYLKIILYN
jgi:hypothetical protein